MGLGASHGRGEATRAEGGAGAPLLLPESGMLRQEAPAAM